MPKKRKGKSSPSKPKKHKKTQISEIREQCSQKFMEIIEDSSYIQQLEEELYRFAGSPQTVEDIRKCYYRHFSLLFHAIGLHPELVQKHHPSGIVLLPASELHPPLQEMYTQHKKEQQKYQDLLTGLYADEEAEGFMKCPQCHTTKNIGVMPRQTRSADEPMTLFCSCNQCGKQWRI